MIFGTLMLAESYSTLEGFFLLFLLIMGLAGLVFLSMIARYISLWFQAFVSGAPISLFNIVGMSLRKIPPRAMVNARITLYKAGLRQITVADLETHYLAGGNILHIVRAMIAADKANIPLDWRQATAIDLAGRDLFDAVKTSVNPKVIDCPEKGHYILARAIPIKLFWQRPIRSPKWCSVKGSMLRPPSKSSRSISPIFPLGRTLEL